MNAVTDTAPATPEQLADVDTSKEVYIEFTQNDTYGVRSIRGHVARVHQNDEMEDHVATVSVNDKEYGIFDFILMDGGGDVVLDSGIEANTNATGYDVLEIDEVVTLEIDDWHVSENDGEGDS